MCAGNKKENEKAMIPSRRIWSSEQEAIFTEIREGKSHVVVEARAGCAKTSTAVEAFQYAPEARILYAVFNKKNQREASEKITDSRVDVKTWHAVGFAAIKKHWKNAKPDDGVEYDRCDAVAYHLRDDRETRAKVLKLVSFAKNTCINPTRADLEAICDQLDIEFFDDYIDTALKILDLSTKPDAEHRISFNDMVWLPARMGWARPAYNLIVGDEAQDMSLPQFEMAQKSLLPNGRLILIGDSRQSIYGFRGTAQGGMSMMRETLQAKVLTLTTTYRCPKLVVAKAVEIVPDYKAADAAPEGVIENINDAAMLGLVKPGESAILSRLNAPLMPLALQLLRKQVPARIEGRDIGKQLIGMVRNFKATSIENFVDKVQEWGNKERMRLRKMKESPSLEKKLEVVADTEQTLICLSEGCEHVADIDARITALFQDTDSNSRPAVILSSVHKAKGLEWPSVFILTETFRRGRNPEEDNIYYVAITRSQANLYFVGSGSCPPSPAALPSSSAASSDTGCQHSPSQVPENAALTQKSTKEEQTVPAVPAEPGKPTEIGVQGTLPQPEAESLPQATQQAAMAIPEPPRNGPKLDNFHIPAGMQWRRPGDVYLLQGGEWVCISVNDCCARVRCLTRKEKTVVEHRGGAHEKVRKFTVDGGTMEINSTCEPGDVIRRMDISGLRKDRRKPEKQKEVGQPKVAETTADQKPESEEMKNKSKSKKTKTEKPARAQVSFAGRPDRLRKFKADGLTKAEAFEKIKKEFPGSSLCRLEEIWSGAAKNGHAPAKANKPKPAKKPKAKSSPPPRKPKTETPAATTEPAPAL